MNIQYTLTDSTPEDAIRRLYPQANMSACGCATIGLKATCYPQVDQKISLFNDTAFVVSLYRIATIKKSSRGAEVEIVYTSPLNAECPF